MPTETPKEFYCKLLDLLCALEEVKSNRRILESSCETQEDFQQGIYKLAGVYFTIAKEYGFDEEQELVEEFNE